MICVHNPKVRLADFARVHIKAGHSAVVQLSFGPKEQALVIGNTGVYHPSIVVPAGTLEVHVGGGQPDFTTGVLRGKVTVKDSGALTTHYTC